MFARLQSLFFLFFIALCASAATVDVSRRTDGDSVTCNANTGTQQCCTSVVSGSDPIVSILEGLLGIVLGALNVDVGLTCSPITVIGTGTTQFQL
ncbi:hypothetical protein H0H93_000744 [Arthromyces matolae]|nr:hypothetical protein H0H93_000744 [Arthromyces matolae]